MINKYITIAPVGDRIEVLFLGLRDFPTEKVVLLCPHNRLDEVKKIKIHLDKFKIQLQVIEIEGNIWEEIFEKIAKIKNIEKDKEIIVNTSTGDRNTQCASTSAAFVNGLKAFAVEGNETMLLPILKFSYYKLLTDKKMGLLKLLYAKDCCSSLEELSKRSGMSLPLVSYHVNGTLKSEGLKTLGLVETKEISGKIDIKLTTLGRLLLKGYI